MSVQGLTAAAKELSVEQDEIWTLMAVETCGCGFLPDRRPQILFERHIFHKLTGGRFDDGDISDPAPGGYGAPGAHQYDRLNRAIALDRAAALASASWGLGQIMGENFKLAGFDDVESMAAAMSDSEDSQLQAISCFLKNSGLDTSLRTHDWASFAAGYNGPSYAENNYDSRLEEEFQKYSSGNSPDLEIRAVQLLLTFGGYDTGGIDGISGPKTAAAIQEFQSHNGLPQTSQIDNTLLGQLLRVLEPGEAIAT